MKYLLAALITIVVLCTPSMVFADANDQVFGACNADTTNSPVCQTSRNPKENPAIHYINITANIIALLTGIISVIMIIIGGLNMITSGGNAEAVTNGRRRILAAVVALVIVLLAWTITRFITDRVIQ